MLREIRPTGVKALIQITAPEALNAEFKKWELPGETIIDEQIEAGNEVNTVGRLHNPYVVRRCRPGKTLIF